MCAHSIVVFFSSWLMLTAANAALRLPDASDQAAFKKLAAQTVVFIERSSVELQKFAKEQNADKIKSQITRPAQELQARWADQRFSDAVLASYSACPNALISLQGLASDATRLPYYLTSEHAEKKIKWLTTEDLPDCKRLSQKTPDFNFAK